MQRPPLINRELSWLDFNARVLHEALDDRTPLLERVKFLAIVSTNLDEFYMVRVGGLRRHVATGRAHLSSDGLTPHEQLELIDRRVRDLLERQQRCLHGTLLPELRMHGVRLLRFPELSADESRVVNAFFEAEVYPVLTPLVVDPGHPFPYISNLSLSLAVEVRDPQTGKEHFARVKVPKSLPRWVPVGRPNHFVPLEEVIAGNLGALFRGMEILGAYPFRVTRFSDMEMATVEEEDDLLSLVERHVFERRFGEVVRLEAQPGMPEWVRQLIADELHEETETPAPGLRLTERDVFESEGLLDLGDLMTLAGLDLPELRDPPFVASVPAPLRDPDRSIFGVIREQDILVHHPFEAFSGTVERFLETAARDDCVLAIKLALYRTSGDTAIVRSLIEAAQNGKQVAVLVELTARFDEENNIQWARTLEDHGIHVGYGSPQLKTHSKVALVVRRESDGIRRYVHVGTGNYNSRTARLYTDLGLFTCDPAIGADASDLFNSLTGYSRPERYRRLIVAPAGLRGRLLELVDREAAHARSGRPARIVAKMNALSDTEVIQALCLASQAGVDVDLVVRGICCLQPGVADVSDRVRVLSVVGRFLEHTRIWRFENGGEAETYIGSADWMTRNLDHRVEVVAPVRDPALHQRLCTILDTYLADDRQAWELGADGVWSQRLPTDGSGRPSQIALMLEAGVTLRRDGTAPVPELPLTEPDAGVQSMVDDGDDTFAPAAPAVPAS